MEVIKLNKEDFFKIFVTVIFISILIYRFIDLVNIDLINFKKEYEKNIMKLNFLVYYFHTNIIYNI
jgi:hypothetical protein